MKWVEVIVKTIPENEDIVSSILYEAGAVGLALEDPQDFIDLYNDKESWDFIDEKLMNFVDDGSISLKAYFAEDEGIDRIIDFIKEKIVTRPLEFNTEALGEVALSLVDDQDFAENWKKYYKPLRIGERIVIKPSWEDYDEKENDIIIELDPGMAFGTGTHETTSMCTEALESFLKPGDSVYDVGCGSGILSIVAAKLGASKVIGIDIDPICIDVSEDNIALNNVKDIVGVEEGNLFDLLDDKVDIIVSNIIAEVIVGIVRDLDRYLNDEGFFIASGIILSKVNSVKNALTKSGYNIIDIKELGEWACLVAQKQ
ncbi:MAG TPA: 50S ribosomal protein L11 methyltransferase [Tissierellaceae bacterium]|nr:50S ribosomal protein L11 methyltransferase [Tissierellaceae bacterium]